MRMMIIMLLLRAWIIETTRPGVKARDLADDILMVAFGKDHLSQLIKAVEQAYEYMTDMGAKVATQKSILFVSSTATRKQLKHHKWSCGDRIPVVGHARNLGAHLATSNRNYSATLRARLTATTAMVRKIHRLPITYDEKVHVIRTKALAKALYGCEASLLHPSDQMVLTTAIKQAISKEAKHTSVDLTFITSSGHTDIDPETVTLIRRVTMLRRMLIKRPRRMAQVLKILHEYKIMDYMGTDVESIHKGMATIAPMPGKPGRHAWKPVFRPFGPVGILLTQLHEKAAGIDEQLWIQQRGYPPIDICGCPLQELRPLVEDIAVRARTAAARDTRVETKGLYEVDKVATCKAYKHLEPREANYLRIAQQCATWSKTSINKNRPSRGQQMRPFW